MSCHNVNGIQSEHRASSSNIFIFCVGKGFVGAPLATSMTQWLLPIFTIIYIFFVQGKEAWGGFSRKAFEEWPLFLRLGVPGMIMMCAEYVSNFSELSTFWEYHMETFFFLTPFL